MFINRKIFLLKINGKNQQLKPAFLGRFTAADSLLSALSASVDSLLHESFNKLNNRSVDSVFTPSTFG
jgi:hypothetical protein